MRSESSQNKKTSTNIIWRNTVYFYTHICILKKRREKQTRVQEIPQWLAIDFIQKEPRSKSNGQCTYNPEHIWKLLLELKTPSQEQPLAPRCFWLLRLAMFKEKCACLRPTHWIKEEEKLCFSRISNLVKEQMTMWPSSCFLTLRWGWRLWIGQHVGVSVGVRPHTWCLQSNLSHCETAWLAVYKSWI